MCAHLYFCGCWRFASARLNKTTRRQNGEETFGSFIDFQKAFDCVNHDFLLYKLWNNGVIGQTHDIIKAIYSSPSNCVRVNNHCYTDWSPLNQVWDRLTLCPTLFALFINDLATKIKSANIGVPISYDTQM